MFFYLIHFLHLNNIEEKFPFLKENEKIENKEIKDINLEEEDTNKETVEKQMAPINRPKTGFRSVASHTNTNFIFNKNIIKTIKRPQTSNFKELSIINKKKKNFYSLTAWFSIITKFGVLNIIAYTKMFI